mgnify:CR=1 FL=1
MLSHSVRNSKRLLEVELLTIRCIVVDVCAERDKDNHTPGHLVVRTQTKRWPDTQREVGETREHVVRQPLFDSLVSFSWVFFAFGWFSVAWLCGRSFGGGRLRVRATHLRSFVC